VRKCSQSVYSTITGVELTLNLDLIVHNHVCTDTKMDSLKAECLWHHSKNSGKSIKHSTKVSNSNYAI